jgi:Zn-finger nucleic acid-binding protein
VTVDACPRCAGVFFDEGEINRIRLDGNDRMAEVEEAIRPAEDFTIDYRTMSEKPRACPGCGSSMDKIRYLYNSPVMLDSCPKCAGVWVEDGELRHMRDVLEGSFDDRGAKVRTEAYVAIAELQARTDANLMRVKRLERAMRLFGRRSY